MIHNTFFSSYFARIFPHFVSSFSSSLFFFFVCFLVDFNFPLFFYFSLTFSHNVIFFIFSSFFHLFFLLRDYYFFRFFCPLQFSPFLFFTHFFFHYVIFFISSSFFHSFFLLTPFFHKQFKIFFSYIFSLLLFFHIHCNFFSLFHSFFHPVQFFTYFTHFSHIQCNFLKFLSFFFSLVSFFLMCLRISFIIWSSFATHQSVYLFTYLLIHYCYYHLHPVDISPFNMSDVFHYSHILGLFFYTSISIFLSHSICQTYFTIITFWGSFSIHPLVSFCFYHSVIHTSICLFIIIIITKPTLNSIMCLRRSNRSCLQT